MKPALIIGRAGCVWNDIKGALGLFGQVGYAESAYDVIAINGVGCDLPFRIDHWVSFHAELFPMWMQNRRDNGYPFAYPDGYQLWTSARGRHMTEWEKHYKIRMVDCNGGSSGMVAVLVALEIGAPKIVLAGVPLENEYGHYDKPGWWDEAHLHRVAWEKLAPEVKARIRSLSGWTKEFFGSPKKEWLTS